MGEYNAYVGLDIHKKTISVAIAQAGRNSEGRSYGTIGNTPEQIRKLAAKLTQRHGALHFVYEARPTGYVPWRTLIEPVTPARSSGLRRSRRSRATA